MRNFVNWARCLAVSITCSLPAGMALAQAGGLFLPENGGPINGTAQAGSAALARDAETAFLNPAGMTRLEKSEVMLSVMPFGLIAEFDPSNANTTRRGDGGDQGGWLAGSGLFAAIPVHDRVALGFSVTSPAGAALDPDNDWAGQIWMTEVTLLTINLEPSIGVRLTDEWSIGAALDVQYMTFEQKLSGPTGRRNLKIDGDSWDVGFSVSTLWEVSEWTRIGMRYRSKVDHDLSGDFVVQPGEAPISTSFTLPQSVTVSLFEQFTDTFALMADFGWSDWSAFDRNEIAFSNSGQTVELPRNFQDTWNASLGAHITPCEQWLVMLGAGYTSSAVGNTLRTPDLLVDQQVRGSLGLEYEINESWKVGGNYTFAWFGENKIDQARPVAGRLVGDYDVIAHLIGLYGSFRF